MKTVFKTNDRFNRLVILSHSHKDKHGRNFFNVKCDCGIIKKVQGSLMSSGNTKSCGCLSKEIKSHRISDTHTEVTAIILGYKRHALDRGFKWEITRDEVEKLISKNCFYCGLPPSNIKKTKNSIDFGLKYSGIDRINSKLNYTNDNIVPCCRVCNYAKSNMSITEFKEWAIRLGKKAMADQWG